MYAIVDIETTGGHASAHGITEIAIVLHDGKQVTDVFETLLNPMQSIPVYIQALTGISDEMVSAAPLFESVAEKIHTLLADRIFVAHNVNFDYSFVKYHLSRSGYELNAKKLCTVRLGRKIFPGLPSYSLGRFSRSMGLENEARHRAAGDAGVTARLFSMMLEADAEGHIVQALKVRSREQSLPPNLQRSEVDKLPNGPGVYYFHNKKNKVIYVGKARNIQKRVYSHFGNNKPSKQKQGFLREIYSISYESCGSELMALILEASEIKQLWPFYNRSLKRFQQGYGLFAFEDNRGYMRLALDKKRKFSTPVYTCNTMEEGYRILRQLAEEFRLCPVLCFLRKDQKLCIEEGCAVCQSEESPETYNMRVEESLEFMKQALPSFAIIDRGRNTDERSCILVEKGILYGMGYLHEDVMTTELEELRGLLKPYPHHDYVRNLVFQYANTHPEKKLVFA